MDGNPYASPQAETHEAPPPPHRRRRVVELLLVVAIIGLLVALLLPATRSARPAARRAQCGNQLKQIGLALATYEEVHGQLPPAYTVDANGQRLHSWRTLLLPYLEQETLYKKIDLTKSWDHPDNREVFETPVSVYHCPSLSAAPNHTIYSAAVGDRYFLHPTESRLRSQFTDSPATTIAVMEVETSRSVPWMQPTDAGETSLSEISRSMTLPHEGGFQVLFADGGTRFLLPAIDIKILRAMLTIAGDDDDLIRDED